MLSAIGTASGPWIFGPAAVCGNAGSALAATAPPPKPMPFSIERRDTPFFGCALSESRPIRAPLVERGILRTEPNYRSMSRKSGGLLAPASMLLSGRRALRSHRFARPLRKLLAEDSVHSGAPLR